jgi:phospholipid/cholesterol/gamma-HCH transport system substrate-binding protein
VGGLIVVALLILMVSIIILGGEAGIFSERYELIGRFKRISGLQSGAPVWLAGQKVGYVSNIEFVKADDDTVYIDVTLKIDKKVQGLIRSDSEARISTLGLLGDKLVGLSLGTQGARILQDGEYVTTNNPLDIEELISKGVETFEDLSEGGKSLKSIAAKLDTGDGTLARLINDDGIYADLAKLADYSQKIAGRIERNEGTIGRLFSDPELYDKIVFSVERTQALIDTIESGSGTLGRLIKDPAVFEHISHTLGNIDTLVARIEHGQGTAGQLISSDQLYNELAKSAASLDSLLIDIRSNPMRYFKVKVTIF